MRRRDVVVGASALALGCGNDMLLGLGNSMGFMGGSVPAVIYPDLRLLGLGSKLLAYYDIRSSVSGGQASITLSSTLQKSLSSTSPTVTCSLSGKKQVYITYTLGGSLGTMKYIIWYGDTTGNSVITGTSSAGTPTVNVGGSDTITFGAGTYVINETAWVECTSVTELTGLANATFTSTLAGRGARYEAAGLNGRLPSLLFNNSAFANESGVPALVTGTDTAVEIWLLGETDQHISSTGASVMWGFSNQSSGHTTKSYLRLLSCGPVIGGGLDSRYAVQRRDSQASPATATLTCDQLHADLDPRVIRSVLGSSSQVHLNGMPGKASAASTNRGVATTLDRATIGGGNLGTAGFSSANWWLGRFTAYAITQPLSDSEALNVTKALAA